MEGSCQRSKDGDHKYEYINPKNCMWCGEPVIENPEYLTNAECDSFRQLQLSFNGMVRAIYRAGRNSK